MKTQHNVDEFEVLANIRAGLTRQFQLQGHGSRKRTLDRIGMSKSSLDMAFTRGSLKVVQLLRILRELDVDPGRFFLSVIPPESFEALPEGKPPPAVKIGIERRRAKK